MKQYTMVYVDPDDSLLDIPVFAVLCGDPDDVESGFLNGGPDLRCDLNGNFLEAYPFGYNIEDARWCNTLLEAEADLLIFILSAMKQ